MPSELRLVDVVHTPAGSIATLAVGADERQLTLSALGQPIVDRALELVRERLASGQSLDEASRELDLSDLPRRTERLRGLGGTLLLDDTASVAPDDVRASLRVLADLGRSGLRTVAVIGPLQVDERDRLDEHDAVGRIVVRLDIAQLVVIGAGARHLYMAASLEGSWDGESVLFDTASTAYDFVRATTGPNTVILVSGGAHGDELAELVARLQEDAA